MDPDDTEGMAQAIRRFFDPDVRRDAGLAARALAETRPIERNFQETMDVYEKVLSERGR